VAIMAPTGIVYQVNCIKKEKLELKKKITVPAKNIEESPAGYFRIHVIW